MTNLFNIIFSPAFVYAIIRLTTPILFGTLGAMITQRAGVTNLALEGTMLFASLFGVLGSAYSGSAFVGVLSAILIAVIVSVVLAYFTLELDAEMRLACVAINLLATGATVFLLYIITGDKSMSSSLLSYRVPTVNIPIIQNIPVLGPMLSGHNLLTYIAFFMVLVVQIFLFHTPVGLRLRAVGENPDAAASVGISVIRTKFFALMICGVLCGLGGAYMSMGYMSMFTRDMVAGRGYIAMAASNVGGQAPLGGMLAAVLFGIFDALANNMQQFDIPAELIQTIPYIATIVFLGISSYRKKEAK